MNKDRIEAIRKELQEEIDALKNQIENQKGINKQCYPGINELVISAGLLLGIFSVESFVVNVKTPMEVVLIENSDKNTRSQTVVEPI